MKKVLDKCIWVWYNRQALNGRLAQLGEHLPYKQRVTGSSPVLSTRAVGLIYRDGLVAQLVRALACHARGRGFEPHPSRHRYASGAQLVEQGTENPRVVGSIPTGGTIYADLAHLVERRLAKAKVAGSSPVIRSKENGYATTYPLLIAIKYPNGYLLIYVEPKRV